MGRKKSNSIDERDELARKWENEKLDRLFAKWKSESKENKARFAWVEATLQGEH